MIDVNLMSSQNDDDIWDSEDEERNELTLHEELTQSLHQGELSTGLAQQDEFDEVTPATP